MEQTQNGGSPHALSTAVVVLKPKPGGRGETLRVPGFELRHEPDHRRLVLHRNGTDVGHFDTDQLEGWHTECGVTSPLRDVESVTAAAVRNHRPE